MKIIVSTYGKFLKEKNKFSFSDLKKNINKKMYYIVGDIGNTSTRICLLNNKSKILKSKIFDTKNIFYKGFASRIFKSFF